MKLAIIDSRSLTDIDISPYIPENVTEIISGGAKGVDTSAETYADKHKLSKHIIRPDYRRYTGKSAPILRNQRIVEEADMILIFWDGKSKGTLRSLNLAKKLEKEFILVEIS